jgi:hypothetical protein
MDTYTIQQILDRCLRDRHLDVISQFEEIYKTIRMRIIEDFGWDDETCAKISRKGEVDLLRYAHENGCHWDRFTCVEASGRGHLECLKYLHENGCSWDRDTRAKSSWMGHLECLKYAHENGCQICA